MKKMTKLLTAAIAGIMGASMAASSVHAGDTKIEKGKGRHRASAKKNSCAAGQNACKGKGACKTADHACAGKNACKGMGGGKAVAAPAAPAAMKANNSCKGQNDCKGKGGCKTGDAGCAGKNSCKGKGGCATAK